MICTKCSTEVTPVVAIDIDGTLGNYHAHFIKFAEAYLGRKAWLWVQQGMAPVQYEEHYEGDGPFREWFCRAFGVDGAVWRDIKLAYRQGAQKRSMPVYGHASLLVNNLRDEHGAEIWLTTTRPYMRLDNIDPDTRDWLRREEIPFDYMLYDERKYSVLASRVDTRRVVAVLDDLPEQYAQAADVFGPDVPILRGTSYNSYHHQSTRNVVTDLRAAAHLINLRIDRWRETHE